RRHTRCLSDWSSDVCSSDLVVQHGRFDLSWTVRQPTPGDEAEGSPAYIIEFSGPDQDLLLEKNAALLDALESVVFKAVRLEEDRSEERRVGKECRYRWET